MVTLLSLDAGAKINMGTIELVVGQEVRIESEPSTYYTVTGYWSKTGNAFYITARSSRSCTIRATSVGTATLNWLGVINSADAEMEWKIKVTAATVKVTKITLNKSQMNLAVNGQEQLTASVLPSNAANKSVTWKARDTNIATVDNNGNVTGKSEGKTKIVCSSIDGSNIEAECEVEVYKVNATGVSLNKSSATVYINETLQLTATVSPSNASDKSITWKSDNTSIATVSSSGLVKGIAEGTTTIRATTSNGLSSTCIVNVKGSNTDYIFLPTLANVKVGSTTTLTYCTIPKNATNSVEWDSDDTSIATVTSSGIVKGIKEGSTVIRVKTDNGRCSACKINVASSNVSPSDIKIINGPYHVEEGYSLRMYYELTPSDAVTKLTWTSEDPSVMTVSKEGVITSIKPSSSSTCISVKTDNGKESKLWVYSGNLKEGNYYKGYAQDGRLWSYKITDKEKMTCHISSTITYDIHNSDLVVPSELCGYTVTSYSGCWYQDYVVSVTLPNTITVVPKEAFKQCTGLVTVTLPENLKEIGEGAFSSCHSLKNINIPKTVISIGDFAFSNCHSLEKIDLPEHLAKIGRGTFYSCNSLNSVSMPKGITEIGNRAFTWCDNLEEIELPSNLQTIGEEAFDYSRNLKTIKCFMEKPIAIDESVFRTQFSLGDATLYVPFGTKSLYASADVWKNFKNIVEIGEQQDKKVTSITLSNTELSMAPGEEKQITATILPEDATDKSVSWTTDNTAVATVSEGGLVTAVGQGTATITCKAKDGSGVQATCSISVVAQDSDFDYENMEFVSVTTSNNLTSMTTSGTLTMQCTLKNRNSVAGYVESAIIIVDTEISKIVKEGEVEKAYYSANGSVTTTHTISLSDLEPGDYKVTVMYYDPDEDVWMYSGAYLMDMTVKGDNPESTVYAYAPSTTIRKDTNVELPIYMNNSEEVTGFQFDLYLPAGVTVATDSYEDYEISVTSDRSSSSRHVVSAAKQPDGAIRVICYSNKNYTFSGSSGRVLNILLTTDSGASSGFYTGYIKNQIFSSSSSTAIEGVDKPFSITIEDYIPGDVNGDGSVTVVDVTAAVSLVLGGDNANFIREAADMNSDGTINVVDITSIVNLILNGAQTRVSSRFHNRTERFVCIDNLTTRSAMAPAMGTIAVYINDFDIQPGEELAVPILLNNPGDAFTAVQFDMYLPKGLSLVREFGDAIIDIGSRSSARRHTVSSATQADGAERVLSYSNNNSLFSGEEGDILIMYIKAEDDFAGGPVSLKNIVLSRPNDSEGYKPADYTANVTTGIADVHPDTMSNPVFYDLSGRRVDGSQRGVMIQHTPGGRAIKVVKK